MTDTLKLELKCVLDNLSYLSNKQQVGFNLNRNTDLKKILWFEKSFHAFHDILYDNDFINSWSYSLIDGSRWVDLFVNGKMCRISFYLPKTLICYNNSVHYNKNVKYVFVISDIGELIQRKINGFLYTWSVVEIECPWINNKQKNKIKEYINRDKSKSVDDIKMIMKENFNDFIVLNIEVKRYVFVDKLILKLTLDEHICEICNECERSKKLYCKICVKNNLCNGCYLKCDECPYCRTSYGKTKTHLRKCIKSTNI